MNCRTRIGGIVLTLGIAALGCHRKQPKDSSSDGEEGSAEASTTDGTGRCPEKRIEENVLVQTDGELRALEGATYIKSLLIFRSVSTLEPLRCLEELDGELATGYYQSFPSLEPLRNLRRVPYLQLQSDQVDDLTPLSRLEQVDKIDVTFPRVTSLHGLETLETGWVIVGKTAVTNLQGLNNFRRGWLTLTGNEQLASFAGLDSLEHLTYLSVDHGAALEDFTDFPKVPIERLIVNNNYGLRSFVGLEHLTDANTFQIRDNFEIESLDGLQNVTELWPDGDRPGYLLLEENTLLRDLSGLDGLKRLDYIEIKDLRSANLENLHGLEQLEHISYNLTIVGNPKLVSLQALRPDLGGSLMYVDWVEARQNDALPNCEVQHLVDAIRELGGSVREASTMGNLDDACPPTARK